MAARTALFRLFLAWVLMLNGIASAMAAVQHAQGPSVPLEAGETAQAGPVADNVHDGCGDLDPGMVESDAPMPVSINGTGHGASPNCCDPGTCQSSCANTVVPVLASVIHSGVASPGQECPRPTASWHAAPALPHLIRPPIA